MRVSEEIRRIHFLMLAGAGALVTLGIVGSKLSPSFADWRVFGQAAAVVIPISFLPALLWHDRGRALERDAALTLPWIVILVGLIPWIAVLTARLRFPLRDSLFASFDGHLGFSVPAIMSWSAAHPSINGLLIRSYNLVFVLLPAGIVLPAVFGKRQAAERFLLANLLAFLMALPIFALFPAVGPWSGYHFPPTAAQNYCQHSIAILRASGQAAGAGIVCFPSFHVIWAILAAIALWSLRPLRIPATILAALVVVSTVTTGWHYVCDVIAGAIVAGCALTLAGRLLYVKAGSQITVFATTAQSLPDVS